MTAAPPAPEPLYLDRWLLVFDKPAGLLAVPGRGPDKADCLSARVQAQWPDALVVHRLDQATSGLMLFARGASVQAQLNRTFADRGVHKRYLALVAGNTPPDPAWRTIDLPLIADWPNRPLQRVDTSHGKPSLTRWRRATTDEWKAQTQISQEANGGSPHAPPGVPADCDVHPPQPALLISAPPDTSALVLEPVTGRSHQLRVHMQAIDHPILGDALYAPASIMQAAPRLMLHAQQLALAHPVSGNRLTMCCAAPF